MMRMTVLTILLLLAGLQAKAGSYDDTFVRYEAHRSAPSVPMMMRHLPPGSLDPEVLKDRLSHAYARHRNLRRGRCRVERRP
jgi:hypothetical protein